MKIFLIPAISIILIFVSSALYAEQMSPWEIDGLAGKKAPQFTLNDLSGNDISLSSFQGKVVLLNFWATWCPYCREERASLNSLYNKYKDRGLAIIAVSTDRSSKKVKVYLKKIPSDFTVLMDEKSEIARRYRVFALPTSFLISREGIIKQKFMGMRNWTNKESKKLIEGLLKQ